MLLRSEADSREKLTSLCGRDIFRDAFHLRQSQHDILQGRQVREEIETLKHHADLLPHPFPSNVGTIHLGALEEHPALVWLHEKVDTSQ